MIYSSSKNIGFERLSAEVVQLKDRILGYQEQIKSLQGSLKSSEAAKGRQKQHYESIIAEKDAIIKELKNQVAHMAAVAARDGTNTGIPTASTPINKKKVIPNSRRGSGRKKGGQPGHKRHIMEAFEDSEITDVVPHELDISTETCDLCGGSLIDTGEAVLKDEFDIEINVVKKRHEYHIYECTDCGAAVRLQIDKQLKEKNQYGSNAEALALSLMATGNVAVNKVRMLIGGMTAGLMNPSEGFICKLYKRAADGLETFVRDLRRVLASRILVYWDDTVIHDTDKEGLYAFLWG